MKKLLKYFITLVVLVSFGSIGYGLSIQENTENLGNKFIGFGTVGLFLVAMPLFLIRESKGKKIEDYMLTKDNIKKMKNRQKHDNQ